MLIAHQRRTQRPAPRVQVSASKFLLGASSRPRHLGQRLLRAEPRDDAAPGTGEYPRGLSASFDFYAATPDSIEYRAAPFPGSIEFRDTAPDSTECCAAPLPGSIEFCDTAPDSIEYRAAFSRPSTSSYSVEIRDVVSPRSHNTQYRVVSLIAFCTGTNRLPAAAPSASSRRSSRWPSTSSTKFIQRHTGYHGSYAARRRSSSLSTPGTVRAQSAAVFDGKLLRTRLRVVHFLNGTSAGLHRIP